LPNCKYIIEIVEEGKWEVFVEEVAKETYIYCYDCQTYDGQRKQP
jgi:hypothetical protein